ncbi:MAG: sulfatase-like hydrolase/transferase [Mariniblastus sp.]|nr:sulfatase-like hydrolase/transferase [Mariniblastus sp.]
MFIAIQTGFLGAAEIQEKPNVIVIMADDLGNGDLSFCGAEDLQSPNIDALFKSGMRFDFAYANCPVCSPSRASLISGRYPELVGVPGVIRTHPENSWGYMDPDAVLLPEVMKTAGYHTALIGKWHLGLEAPNRPNDRGFDLFHGFLADMMDDYYQHRRHNIEYMHLNDQVIDVKGHATDLFTDWSCDYLKSRVGQSSPFFLCLTYNAPHTPIQPPKDWYQKVKQREPNIDDRRAKLVALIEHMDSGIGRVMKTLRETELERNTLVIFTSDNGGQLNVGANNGALRDGKQSMYEGGLRVPTCFVWPGKIAENSKSEERMITMDIFPTVCEAVGAGFDHPIDGISLLPLLNRKTQSLGDRDLFFHRREGGLRYGGLIANAMIRGNWKLLQNSPFEAQQLYDLSVDPLETRDLKSVNKKKYQEMAQALRVQVQRGGMVRWQNPTAKKK